MNQILDRTSSKKNSGGPRRNPKDTPKIIKVYAALMILFALCLISLGGYTFYDNNRVKTTNNDLTGGVPNIELVAQDDKVTINVSAATPIESVRFQWYTGTRSVEDIHRYNDTKKEDDASELEKIESDEDIEIDEEEMRALGKPTENKGTGKNQMSVQNIGIPVGTNTLHITVRLQGEEVITEFVKTYTTDVGVDKIAPSIKVYFWTDANDPKVIIVARDETEIKNIIYSIDAENGQDVTDVSFSERTNPTTIKAEIPLEPNDYYEISISAVDKAGNTAVQDPEIKVDLIKGKPEIVEFTAETDYSKVYAVARFAKGIKKTEYIINNGEPVVQEYDDLPKQVVIEIPTVPGANHIVVRAYAEKEDLYGEDYGDCEYNP